MIGFFERQRPTLILPVIILAISPLILARPFWIDNSILFATFSLFALSVGMCYGQAGIPSLATGAFGALGGYASAILTTGYGMSPYVGLIVAVCLPMLVAYPVARVVTRLSPLPLSIATLVLGSIIEIAIREGGDFTGGYVGLSGIPAISLATSPFAMHLLAWGCVTIVLFVYCNLLHTAFGRAVNTAKHDPLRAIADGVDVPNVLATFFAISAAVAGLGGWLYVHNLSYIGPDSLNVSTSMQVLLMAIVGGVLKPLGPVIGACLLLLIVTYLPAAESQGMVYGGALIVILLLVPQGLIGTTWWSRARLKAKQNPGAPRSDGAAQPSENGFVATTSGDA
ncbi:MULTISPECIES: branched-chain amino acid ABC transporter permease [Sinorhizobium]|uniref:branched-chain amino acid ABC transporter permease n=1 Tax=Sinorhizobium TaxID=28105 RepID=UPI000BE90698|nr:MULTISPECIES: branched-chain amino acid ABC transporter permease [Sinorhizobium]PDT50930.1 branched-chain amino acid ABC transporter permease [Sinorhizobium sp. NG07B]